MSDHQPPQIHPEFQEYINRQPYCTQLDGLTLNVAKDVFPPDMGRCAQNLARLAQTYHANTALDMGCGTGYIALMLKRSGVAEVWASDVHGPAVECARLNANQNEVAGPIQVVQGDLFESVPRHLDFDLIVFNQPFGPGAGDPVCGCGSDGGYEITRRFLIEAADRLTDHGVVLMAFSDREPMANSPDVVAKELGLAVKTILHAFYGGANNFIFEIQPQRSAEAVSDERPTDLAS